MSRPLFRLSLYLSVLFVLPIALFRAWSAVDLDLSAGLALLGDCPAPCLMGIQPGVTTLPEALERLRAHEWVDTVQMHAYELGARGLRGAGWLTWTWRDNHPALIDSTRPGRIRFSQSLGDTVIESIGLPTTLRAWHVQRQFGTPDAGAVAQNNDETVSYLLIYRAPLASYGVKVTLACPADLIDYWHSRAEISITVVHGVGVVAPVSDFVRLC